MKQNPSQKVFSMFNFLREKKGNKCENVNGIHALLMMSRVKVKGK